MATTDTAHPVRFDIDYPEDPRNRLTSAFRLILAIPILAVIAAIGAAGSSSGDPTSFMCIAAGVLFLPSLMLIVARQKYPRWWFDFSVAYLGFHNRVVAYLLLLRDEYPSTDEEQTVEAGIAAEPRLFTDAEIREGGVGEGGVAGTGRRCSGGRGAQRRKSSRSRLSSSGRSRLGRCPAPSILARRAPGICAAR